jgi:hypothetical protein
VRVRARHLLLAIVLLGCKPSSNEHASNKPFPDTPAQAASLQQSGVTWENGDIRAFYLARVGAIGPANEQWKRESVPAEERARRAYQMRRDARILARVMMKDRAQVEALRRRDQEKYGSPDGPALEWLIEKEKKKGLLGDAIWEAIVESAQRTNTAVNEMFGL